MRAPVHVTAWGSGRRDAARAVLVHGTMTWGTGEHGFTAQRALADVAELLVVDRRRLACADRAVGAPRCRS